MAHTQHGNDDRKKRKKPPCKDILVSTGPWLRAQWANIGGTFTPCPLWPGNPPWSDPITLHPATPPAPDGRCWWSFRSGTFPGLPAFQLFVFWGEEFSLPAAWYCQMNYFSDGSVIPAGAYETDFIGPTTDDPSGTYTQDNSLAPLCPTADPSTIAVTLLP